MTEYVRPKILTEKEHKEYIHPCGHIPPLECEDCPRDLNITCMRDHTVDVSLEAYPSWLSLETKLRIYWEGAPSFVDGDLEEEANPLAA